MVPSGYGRGLRGNWSSVLYRQFAAKYSKCALRFTYNHLRQTDSKKVHAPYWTGKAVCRTGNCVTVHFSITEQPAADEDVTVHVRVVGSCAHLRRSDDDD